MPERVPHDVVQSRGGSVIHLPLHVQKALDGYLVEKELGSGYFGTVYRAMKPGAPTLVVKVLEYAKGWPNEAEATRAVHPALFVNAGQNDEGVAWLATKYHTGHTADRRGASEVLPVIDDVLSDLTRLHEAGWLHNDIKPDNIYVDE